MKKLSNIFYKVSTGWVVITAVLVFGLFLAFVLPRFSERASQYSNGAASPDTSFTYSGTDLYQMAERYGKSGREDFVDIRWTLDLLFPVVYTAFFITTTSWFLRRLVPLSSGLRLLNLVPIAAFLLDLLENSATTLVMLKFPNKAPIAQALAPIFTPLKWIAVITSLLLVLISLVFWIIKKSRHK